MYPYLTDEDIQFLEEDARQYFTEANKKLGLGFYNKPKIVVKTKIAIATTVSKTSIDQQKKEIVCLNYLRSRMRNADPKLKEDFRNKIEGVKFEDE
jgi:hypothetical protein